MSRSGYSDDGDMDQWSMIMYRANVDRAFRGKKGQAFFKEALAALDAMPVKELCESELETADGQVCLLGAVARARGVPVQGIDPECAESVAGTLKLKECVVREVVFENDAEWCYWTNKETPADRFARMRKWVCDNIK